MRDRKRITIYVLVLLPLLLLNISQTTFHLKNAYLVLISPLVTGVDYLLNQSERLFDAVWIEDRLIVENRRLIAKVDELENYLIVMREIEDENQRLKDLLAFKQETPLSSIPAQVIGRDSDRWNQSVMINKGKKDGLSEDLPVVTRYGLVGLLLS